MKKPLLLPVDVTLVNSDRDDQHQADEDHMGTTYRQEGLSIGQNYLRWEGSTVTRGELLPSSVDVEGTIGRGVCSVVERASWKRGGFPQYVALKQFPLASKERQKMLIKELRTLCQVECDCLVRLMGAYMEQNTVTMVLEYMDKGSLYDLLKAKPTTKKKDSGSHIPEKYLSAIAYQMLWGLSYLHFEHILHRDVKPANVLIHSDGFVKLSDFGISSQQKEDGVLNSTVVGTTCYMSPERLRTKRYGSASDIWSFGLVLLECIRGTYPWDHISSMIELVVFVEETTTNDLIPSIASDDLSEVLTACLQRAPEQRIPARILVESPWFSSNGIHNVDTATAVMRTFFQEADY